MSNEGKHYSAKFKTKVAREALEQDKKDLDRLSEKYEVPVSVIMTWAVKLEKHSADVFEHEEKSGEEEVAAGDQVALEVANKDIIDSISFGAMLDRLNYPRLIFWSTIGVVLVIIFVLALIEMYQYNQQVTQEQVSAESQFYQVNQLNQEATEKINNFGVVDLENNIYRIPIDSAINDIVEGQ